MTKQELPNEIHEYICDRSREHEVIPLDDIAKLFAERYRSDFTFAEVQSVMAVWLEGFKQFEREHAAERLENLKREGVRRGWSL